MADISISRRTAIVMWLVASFFYAYQYILRVMPSIMLDDIRLRFGMNAAILGQFSGIYYIGYSLVHIPVGILLDRCGPKEVIPFCVLLSVIGTLPIIFAKHWMWPIVGRSITGIGSSAAILGVFKVIRMAYSEKHFSRMLSFSVMIGLIGAIYGGTPIRSMCYFFSHENVIGILSGIGIFLAILAYAIIPDTKDNISNYQKKSTMFADICSVFKNSKVMIICFSAGLMVGPLEGFADIWGTKFLNQVCGIDDSQASSITSMIFVGMCFGSPILNFIAEKSKNYLGTIICSGLTMFSIFFMLIASLLNVPMLMKCGFVLVGICSAYQILAIYKASTYVSEDVVGITTAVTNMIIMLFGYILHGIIGSVIKIFGGIDINSAFCYGIAVIPITLLMGIIGFAVVVYKDKKCKK